VVSKLRGVARIIKIKKKKSLKFPEHSRSFLYKLCIKIIRQLKQVFEIYRMMFKELKEKRIQLYIIMFLHRKGTRTSESEAPIK